MLVAAALGVAKVLHLLRMIGPARHLGLLNKAAAGIPQLCAGQDLIESWWAAGRGAASLAAEPTRSSSASNAIPTWYKERSNRGSWQGSEASSSGRSSSSSNDSAPSYLGQWTEATNSIFSIRPSYLSPLHSAYVRGCERDARRRLVTTLLRAHAMLAPKLSALDDVQAEATARSRITQMQRLTSNLVTLREQPGLTAATTSRSLMLGLYQLLEQQANSTDTDAEAFACLERGGLDETWQYWQNTFVEGYSGMPGLEPLEVIFAKSEPQALLQKMQKGAAEPTKAATTNPSNYSGGTPAAGELVGKRMGEIDVEGRARAWGRRKTSNAEVNMVAGDGRIMVNGVPYDEYFRNVNIRQYLLQPFFITDTLHRYNVEVAVEGGGLSGQAQAVRHGIARALVLLGPQHKQCLWRLTRWDGRQVERKKPARHGARAGWTYVRR